MAQALIERIDELDGILRADTRRAGQLGRGEVRFLVDAYYQAQDDRKRSQAQARTLDEAGEPHKAIDFLAEMATIFETRLKLHLDRYSKSHPVGEWARAQKGLGPVTTAGLLAHIDITKAPTVGHVWRFAGLDPTVTWGKGQKRPWNARLKVICFHIGESFVKIHRRPDAFYGDLYAQRKAQEESANANGELAGAARAALEAKKFDKTTEAYAWYSGQFTIEAANEFLAMPPDDRIGWAKRPENRVAPGEGIPMLPPAHIHARAKRWTVKLFLAHLHHVWYQHEYKQDPPKPYVIEHGGHAHPIVPPGM